MNKTVRINPFLIEYFVKKKEVKHLAYFMLFKYKFVSSTVYYKSYSDIARKFNISSPTAKHYIKYFIKEGLCTVSNDKLIFLKQKDIMKLLGIREVGYKFWTDISVNLLGKANSVAYIIEEKLIEKNIKQQEFVISKKKKTSDILLLMRDNPQFIGKKEFRVLKSIIRDARRVGISFSTFSDAEISSFLNYNKTTVLSNESIGYLIGKSKSTGSKRQKLWNDVGLIKSKPKYKILDECSDDVFRLKRRYCELPMGSFFSKGKVLVRLPNELCLISTFQ